jgi:hypothetical protein
VIGARAERFIDAIRGGPASDEVHRWPPDDVSELRVAPELSAGAAELVHPDWKFLE